MVVVFLIQPSDDGFSHPLLPNRPPLVHHASLVSRARDGTHTHGYNEKEKKKPKGGNIRIIRREREKKK